MELLEWARHYLRHKDVLKKDILEISDADYGLCVKRKSGDQKVFTQMSFQGPGLYLFPNSKDSIAYLVSNWEQFAVPGVTVAMVSGQSYWLVHPFTHNKITEDIEKSLLALYNNSS